MKKFYTLLILAIVLAEVQAQTIVTTIEGRRIILYANGTWQPLDSSNLQPVQDIKSMYKDAYQYAYDIMYSDEFFPSQRRNKATDWAVDYVKNGINIAIGRKFLESWYDDLYEFAGEYLYKDIFFGTERKEKAAQWAAQTLKSKAYYEDYSMSFIAKHKAAYNVAYSKIFKTEFFATERKKKALNWANEFVKR
jgi:hypothetical protein